MLHFRSVVLVGSSMRILKVQELLEYFFDDQEFCKDFFDKQGFCKIIDVTRTNYEAKLCVIILEFENSW